MGATWLEDVPEGNMFIKHNKQLSKFKHGTKHIGSYGITNIYKYLLEPFFSK